MKRIRIVFFLLLGLFSGNISYSQNWINSAGGLTHDEALDVCHDQNGNYYVTGYFTNAATFDNTNITGYGFSDIFIAKYNANGQLVWVKNAGGNGPDRGYSIYNDQQGNLFVTGYFTGSATFDATTLTSPTNTQDVFIAKYDTNGNLSWVTSVGGNFGDTGYGITTDNLGNVIVTGQYKGTATFGATTLTSVTDPNTNQPSYDIFIVKYDANGNFLWVQNGAAKYDDRGMDVATDDANNIYVVGQYSDTITIDFTYNNYVMNAGFLLKLDASGQEIFFKSMSGVQVLVYSLAIDNSNNVFITGDFRGTLGIVGSPTTYVNASYYNKIFIAKFSDNGTVLWAEADASDNEVTSKSIDLDDNGDPYITGLFKCRFNEYSDLYGDAIFYSAGYRDVFITKYSSAGIREWVRHFGGPKDDYCSGIAVKDINEPFIAGGYELHFNVPSTLAFLNNSNSNTVYSVQSSPFCSDPNYTLYKSLDSEGQKDIFLTKPFDINREPYDYFVHSTNSSCVRDTLPICTMNCVDTIASCGDYQLYPNFFNASPGYFHLDTLHYTNPILGPGYNLEWSTGSIVDTAWARHTGDYWIEISREDGCMTHRDSIYFIEYGYPSDPLISDDEGINFNHIPDAEDIYLCYPDTVRITASNVFMADTFYWSGPQLNFVNDSVIDVSVGGYYLITSENEFGCITTNRVNVIIYQPPTDSLELSTYLVDPIFEASDTVTVCAGLPYQLAIQDTVPPILYSNNIPSTTVNWYVVGPSGYVNTTNTNHVISVYPTVSGWYTVYDTLYKICGDSLPYYSEKTYYVNVIASPSLTSVPNQNGGLICPGDTAWATIETIPDSLTYNWSGVGIIENYNDSIRVIVTSNNQLVSVGTTYLDTTTGCSTLYNHLFHFYTIPAPVITISPTDGIICPFDSVLLSAPNGVSWQWVGPNGNVIGFTQQIYVSVPGYYHCIVEDFTGCIQTSNTVEAKEYNTPYLDVFPSNFICANGNTTLTVVASNSALIQWQPPLSGNSTTQVVSSPGTYVCEITLCGITTVDSIVVTQSNTPSFISSNDTVICPGDTIMLMGNGGMSDYEWNPGGSHDPFLYITQPGSYILTTTDAYGCFGTSAPFNVYAAPQPAPPVSNDTLICAGQSITISATATNAVLWYSSATSTIPLDTGNVFTTPIINSNTSYFVQTYDAVCGSSYEEIQINIYSSSSTPQITGDTTLCFGQLLQLNANQVAGADYFWTGPNGITSDSSSLYIFPVDVTNSGVYTLYYSDTSCTSPTVSINVVVDPLPQPYIYPDTTIFICAGNSVTLTDTVGYSNYVWWPGNQAGNSITVSTPGNYYVTATENGCSGVSNVVTVATSNPALDPIPTPITICPNTSGVLTAIASDSITWYDENMNYLGSGNNYQTPVLDTTTIYYVLNTTAQGCESNYVPVVVIVPPLDSIPPVYVIEPICEGSTIYLYTLPLPGATFSWTGPNGFTSTVDDPQIPNASSLHNGLYTVTIALNGCSSLPGSVNVLVHPNPNAPNIIGDLVYCDGDSVLLSTTIDSNLTYQWYSASGMNYDYDNDSLFTYVSSMAENGINFLYVMDSIGCYDSSTVNIIVHPIPTGTINHSGDICVGGNLYFTVNNNSQASFDVNGPDNYSSANLIDSIINASNLNDGIYTVTFELNGCTYSDSIEVTVSDFPIIDLGPDTALCMGGEVIFSLNPAYDFIWQDGSTNNEFTALDSGIVYVTASIYPGCETSDTAYVDLMQCSSLFPNVFTPNGDGQNDVFGLMNNEGAQSIHVEIYNRWGRKIYEINEMNQVWRGTDWQLEDLPEGVYFWIASVVNYFGTTERHQGYVHLYR